MVRGVYLAGGGAMIKGMPELMHEILKVPVYVAEEPLTAMVRGAGVIVERINSYEDILVPSDDELSPTT